MDGPNQEQQGARTPAKAVHYRNPPAEHRFKPGTSGNPKGRPKKKPVLSFNASNVSMFDRNDQVLLEVVSRPIMLREGAKTESVSGLEALYRSMLRNAAEGDAATGRILLQLIEKAESRRAAYQQELLAGAMQHLETWNEIFYERELQGLPPPDVYPHPAHIEINRSMGQVIFHGPVTRADAASDKALDELTITKVSRLWEVEEELAADPRNAALKAERKQLKPFEDHLRQMGQRNIRLEIWRLARAAQAKSLNPPVPKQRRKKTQKASKTE
jgi:hypothetical protein